MELNIYDIIVGPVASHKSYYLNNTLKKLMIYVHPQANKSMVASAIFKLFNIEVESVNIMVRKGKHRISRTRNHSVDNLKKIAIVTLKKGQDMSAFGNPTSVQQNQPAAE